MGRFILKVLKREMLMQIASKATLAVCAATAFIAAACSSAPTQTADAKPDPRQGEQVKNICFQSQIRNWRKNDRRSILSLIHI